MTDIFNINLRQMKIAKENTIFDRSNNLNVIYGNRKRNYDGYLQEKERKGFKSLERWLKKQEQKGLSETV